jgi:hypothetical protein
LVLLRETDALDQQELATIGEVRAAVESKGSQLQFQVVAANDTSFSRLANAGGITTFPAFLVFGQRDSLALSQDHFSRATILSVFVPSVQSGAPCGATGRSPR